MPENDPQSARPVSLSARIRRLLRDRLVLVALASLAVLIGVLALFIGARKEQLVTAKQAARVETRPLVNAVLLELKPRPMAEALNLPGAVEPWLRLDLVARITGTVEAVLVAEGDRVQAGQTLARLEAADYRIAVNAARAAHTLARADYDRGRAMLKTRVIPTATLESTAARLQTAAADLERAELNLARCEITAPMDAVIKRLDAKVGLYLAVGDPVGELLHIDRVKAVVGIPESDVDAVRRLDQVALTIQALGNRPLVGRSHFLAPSPDSSAYLYRLELALDNPGHDILPGMFFRARIVKKSIPDALAVPLYSVISRGDEQYVFIAEGDTVRRRPVRLGVNEGWLVQVVEGLAPGDRVLVEGHREVEEGQGIRVIRTLTDPGQGTP